jgi:hypothetical protein
MSSLPFFVPNPLNFSQMQAIGRPVFPFHSPVGGPGLTHRLVCIPRSLILNKMSHTITTKHLPVGGRRGLSRRLSPAASPLSRRLEFPVCSRFPPLIPVRPLDL